MGLDIWSWILGDCWIQDLIARCTYLRSILELFKLVWDMNPESNYEVSRSITYFLVGSREAVSPNNTSSSSDQFWILYAFIEIQIVVFVNKRMYIYVMTNNNICSQYV